MKHTKYISFFIVIQMVIGFGLVPAISLKLMLGPIAVLIYCMTSFLIISVFALLLWFRTNQVTPNNANELNSIHALGFGMIFAFIMAEIVSVILVSQF